METLKIKLGNIYLLESELNGVTHTPAPSEEGKQSEPIVIIKGFINEVLPLSTKFWLLELNKEVQAIKTTIEGLREDLIKKYGVSNEDGSIYIPVYEKGSEKYDETGNLIDAKLSEQYSKFQEEYSNLMVEEKELKYMPIPLSVLDKIETEHSYSFILQNLVEKVA